MDGPEKVWFREARHVEVVEGGNLDIPDKDAWRKIKERMKTVSVALVLCLNIGVDPPDVQKPNPCARKEAWVEPNGSNPQKTSQKIAHNLQKIYEKLQPRARYKSAIDPTVECVRKLCTSMRRNAKDERVLFHFNGHGVPKPTDAGEIWVFNKNITQYIPLSLFDLQSWMGYPSVYVWDCNSAGTNVSMFMRFADDHYSRWIEEQQGYREPAPMPSVDSFGDPSTISGPRPMPQFKECIQLGACRTGELLPMNPELPADLFTCCLTTPIQTSLLWHMLKTGTKDRYPANIIEEIPGNLTDRRTLLGELNWVFTAITDTIAWSSLPTDTFQKLFRQDLLIASLFRSFLLAERIMRDNNCHVVSHPELPSVYSHPLWEYWDYTLDLCLNNMYNLITSKSAVLQVTRSDAFTKSCLRHNILVDVHFLSPEPEYAYSWFFIEQLQAFEVWLKFGVDKTKPPEQLPVVLQVLLSQVHRVRALELLARFVDLGSWAVVAALSVGIFPYVLKLLQCGTRELRPALAFIWAKILSVDPICQHELVKNNEYVYFVHILNDPTVSPRLKIVPAFVMASLIYDNYRPAQEKLIQSDYVTLCMELLFNTQVAKCKMLCLWVLISLGRMWAQFDKARWHAVRNNAYDRAMEFLDDDVPEVRAAAVYALGCFIHNRSQNNEHATTVESQVCDKLCDKCTYDGSVLVRAELVAAIQWFIIDFENRFVEVYNDLDKRFKPKDGLDEVDGELATLLDDVELTDINKSQSTARMPRNASSFFGGRRRAFERKNEFLVGSRTKSPDYFRMRILFQFRALEAKTFKDNLERIWLSTLRLCFDPFPHVSDMSRKIVSHIMNQAREIRTSRSRHSHSNGGDSEIFGTSGDGQVKFMVGSPGTTVSPQIRKLSSVENVTQLRQCSSISDLLSTGAVETSATTFTPKRHLYGFPSGVYRNLKDENVDIPAEGLVKTQFVEWCSKTFTEPIFKTIYEEGCTSTRVSLVDSGTPFMSANPTDWALQTHEGLKQKSHSDIEQLMSEQVHCDTQQMVVGVDRTVTSCVWSVLRPYVYTCDGQSVTLFNSQREQTVQQATSIRVNEEALIDDAVTDMLVANELTHELLITGTRNGLMKVWDPMFSEHSHEIIGEAKLITSAHLLSDEARIEAGKQPNTTLYRWDQACGKIVCSGNVRVCRLWDAWAEKCVQDLALRTKSRGTTSIAVELSSNLVSCGFDDGTLAVYDVRLPAADCQIMRVRDFGRPIIGSAIFEQHQWLLVASSDGDIRMWEPRMYQEPIVDFNVAAGLRDSLIDGKAVHQVDIHVVAQTVACAMRDSTVRLYDVSGKKSMSQIRYTDALEPSAPTAMRFHPQKVLLGIATKENVFTAYGVPSAL